MREHELESRKLRSGYGRRVSYLELRLLPDAHSGEEEMSKRLLSFMAGCACGVVLTAAGAVAATPDEHPEKSQCCKFECLDPYRSLVIENLCGCPR